MSLPITPEPSDFGLALARIDALKAWAQLRGLAAEGRSPPLVRWFPRPDPLMGRKS